MLKTSLEIAKGTYTQEMVRACEKIIYAMFNPGQLLAFYKAAVIENQGVRDLVLWSSATDPTQCHAGTRAEYRKFLITHYPRIARKMDVFKQSAHSFARVPSDTDAFWLIVTIPDQPLPVMTALYALRYEEASSSGGELKEVLA